jgi:hypothetical protein
MSTDTVPSLFLSTRHRLSFASASVTTGRVVLEAHGSGFAQQTHDRCSPASTISIVLASKIDCDGLTLGNVYLNGKLEPKRVEQKTRRIEPERHCFTTSVGSGHLTG